MLIHAEEVHPYCSVQSWVNARKRGNPVTPVSDFVLVGVGVIRLINELLMFALRFHFEIPNFKQVLQIPDSNCSQAMSNEMDFSVLAPASWNPFGVSKHLSILYMLQVFGFVVGVKMFFLDMFSSVNYVSNEIICLAIMFNIPLSSDHVIFVHLLLLILSFPCNPFNALYTD